MIKDFLKSWESAVLSTGHEAHVFTWIMAQGVKSKIGRGFQSSYRPGTVSVTWYKFIINTTWTFIINSNNNRKENNNKNSNNINTTVAINNDNNNNNYYIIY
jgi:hypothetical protein